MFTLLRRSDEHSYYGDHDHHYYHRIVCGVKEDYDGNMGLRISSIFVIMLFSSLVGTAFVHLLLPAFMELSSSPCLYGIWKAYNFAPILIMLGMLTIFLLELFSLRYISSKCATKSIGATSVPQTNISTDGKNPLEIQKSLLLDTKNDLEKQNLIKKYMLKKDLLTVIILEFGIIFHSIIIGFTLAVTGNKEFITLYIVITFHQMFEGLGLGARLFNSTHVITSISIAIGLAAKAVYNPTSPTAVIISGIFDSLSSGILLYAGLVELLAEDFIINSELRNGDLTKLLYAIFCVILGFTTMAIIGIWV
ncbi:hypothetical protein PMAC_002571 [Pneumocystis sp. 'macacae']|nr:hypothetical protein PMAC_002571 [Pneumocystis sp. 'macacae']